MRNPTYDKDTHFAWGICGRTSKGIQHFYVFSCDALCPGKSPRTNNSSKEKNQGNKKFKCFIYLKKQMKETLPDVSHSDKSQISFNLCF